MQNLMVRKFHLLILVFTIEFCLVVPLAFAQIQNPIQAAKDAYNKAKQQQKQQQAAAAQPANAPGAPPAQKTSASASSGDCCTPEAMKKIAASLGFVDIVGVKLGMTPQQAVAAVKAYNPNLKIETLTARLEHPTNAGSFVRVPQAISAYTANVRQDLGPVEWIAMQFTVPPGPPLLAKVHRYTGFANGQPVMASNLLQSLRKKYGQENYTATVTGWVFDSNGKLLTRVSNLQGSCAHSGYASGVAGGGSGPHPPPGETGAQINLSNTANSGATQLGEAGPDCMPLVWVTASNVGEGVAPNSQVTMMTVTMESGALMSMSLKATHDWLQAELDGKLKEQEDAAAKRAAPKL